MAQPEQHLEITSPDLASGRFPTACTCDGSNNVPKLRWSDPPAGTRSFALVLDDPDAPRAHFVHWLVWNIPGDEREIGPVNCDEFSQGTNGFGDIGWRGPCPPAGDGAHRYVIKVYALDRDLDLDDGAERYQLVEAMRDHVLAEGELVATYERRRGHEARAH